jgi:uncharacterized protein YcbK (DUF882 family)
VRAVPVKKGVPLHLASDAFEIRYDLQVVKLPWSVVVAVAAAAASGTIARTTVADPPVAHGAGLASKKDRASVVEIEASEAAAEASPLLATLVQTHTGENLVLDAESPSQGRFDALLADRVTGAVHPLDPRLLELLRALAAKHPASRIELVSGYRSPKLNEMLRKKGHHVSAHSQHSLGHACDFRIIPRERLEPGDGDKAAGQAISPAQIRKEIRAMGWEGGVGIYPTKADWFVHADVGRKRGWVN